MTTRMGSWSAYWKCFVLLAAIGMLLIGGDSTQAENVIFDNQTLQTVGSPRLRLYQTGPNAYKWDISGNNNGLFVLDAFDTRPLTIEPDAGNNRIYVATSGHVGFGTPIPARHLHVDTTDFVPTLRLESRDPTVAYKWDFEGSYLGFNLVDVTNSSAIPIAVRAGAPTNSFLIDSTGKIGLGTNSPLAPLHVHKAFQAAGAEVIARFSVSDDALGKLVVSNASSGDGVFIPKLQGTSGSQNAALIMEGQITSDLGTSPAIVYNAFRAAGGGALVTRPLVVYRNNGVAKVTINPNGQILATAFTVMSSRTLKDHIIDLDSRKASEALRQLTPVEFVYKDDPAAEKQVGFIAEDVPEIVANADRKSVPVMDVLALVTKVVKDQQQTIDEQKKAIDAQRQANDDQQKVIDELLQRLGRLENQMRDKK